MTRKNQNFYKKEPALTTNENRFLKKKEKYFYVPQSILK
nr:MAG TPA: hypothetical protein [Caudoviricetes sp.]DAM45798.1 MAG TPA: hypothetical protein [Caudoviricetes sp.]DAQ55304.1 MAG TPA: hypothetical protein [Caudoviricetes sp.]DAV44174.1 MAG TPA: hypothetical protein [Caudoviricetes sp.]DAZ69396.1 MAG TPA: hypothetical protein [Caudoviricetes sp.]